MGLDEILMKDSLGKSRLQCLTGVRALQSITENLTWFLKIKTTELYKGSATSKRPTKYILIVQGVSLADGPYIIWLICNAKGNCWRRGGGGDVSSRYAGKLYRYLNSGKHSKDKNCTLLLERSRVLNDKHRSFIRCPLEWIFRSWLSFAGLFKCLILRLTSLATCAVAQDHTQIGPLVGSMTCCCYLEIFSEFLIKSSQTVLLYGSQKLYNTFCFFHNTNWN